jgi:hypothetical protein
MATNACAKELTSCFPRNYLMDAMGVMYSYYWLQIDVEENFQRTLHDVESTLLSWMTIEH